MKKVNENATTYIQAADSCSPLLEPVSVRNDKKRGEKVGWGERDSQQAVEPLRKAQGVLAAANQGAGKTSYGSHRHSEPGGPCFAGCEGFPGSGHVTGRDGLKPAEGPKDS